MSKLWLVATLQLCMHAFLSVLLFQHQTADSRQINSWRKG